MLRAYKYRLYPTEGQRQELEKHFGSVRYVYNWGLGIKQSLYDQEKKTISKKELQERFVHGLKKEKSWLNEVNSQSLLSALLHLDTAYQNFFRTKKGFPKFKSKKDNHYSFQCPQRTTIDWKKSVCSVPKIKEIPIVLHQGFTGKIKTTTISKTASGNYFASVLVDTPIQEIPTDPVSESTTLGIDTGIKSFVVCSDGTAFANHRYLDKSQKRLKVLQKRLQKKTRLTRVLEDGKKVNVNSKNREKARIKVAKLHEKISSQRADHIHQITYKLTHDSQVKTICIEDLHVKGMLKNHHLARSMSDVGIGKFYSVLAYKCAWYGVQLVKIGRFEASSKTCSACGAINRALQLSDRVWTCSACYTEHDRDVNAAINIKRFGLQKLVGQELPEVKSVECPLVDERSAMNLKSNDTMKQKKRRASAPKPICL